ncbi:MAG: N-6 DNA methylase [Myxococcales bacterium]|nr:N-6 DNA methylase [Myxococcales bacterium]
MSAPAPRVHVDHEGQARASARSGEGGVAAAVTRLFAGLFEHPANERLRAAVEGGALTASACFEELSCLVLRVQLLRLAERRGLAPDGDPRELSRNRDTLAGRGWDLLRRRARRLRDGDAARGLLGVGGELLAERATPWLGDAALADRDLEAALALLEAPTSLESLGRVHAALLELHPSLDRGAIRLQRAAGSARKLTGSYFTPASLVDCLLDRALEPVLSDMCASADPERALLDVKVCDPACGAGQLLVAAAARIAVRLASARARGREPDREDRVIAQRDALARCVYGVDIHPRAVELCKLTLWLAAGDPSWSIRQLDPRIQRGDSLLGATPATLARGVPELALRPLVGDAPDVARRLRSRSRAERSRSVASTRPPALGWIADAWCAAFVSKKTDESDDLAITDGSWAQLCAAPSAASRALRERVESIAREHALVHWHLRFPEVLHADVTAEGGDGWSGGFDCVVVNPPWERIKLVEREYFAARAPHVAAARNAAARKRIIAALAREDPALWRQHLAARRRVEERSALIRGSGRYPLTSRGDLNTFSLFTELARSLSRPGGGVGLVVPAGLLTDASGRALLAALVRRGELRSALGFRETRRVFSGTDCRSPFALVTLRREASDAPIECAFGLRDVAELSAPGRSFHVTAGELARINPNTGGLPVFRSARDAAITRAIYDRVPVLQRERGEGGDPWGVKLLAMLHMANDSGRFVERGSSPARDGGEAPRLVPLYEAKLIHQYDHRFATYERQTEAQARRGKCPELSDAAKRDREATARPRYWVDAAEVERRLPRRWRASWLLCWRDICRRGDRRSLIAAVIPRVAVADTLSLALPGRAADGACLLANLNALVLDYVARQKIVGAHLKFHALKQLPVLPPSTYEQPPPWGGARTLGAWVRARVVELVFTATALTGFARDHGWDGPPFPWDPERRAALQAELDAAYFALYGLGLDDAAHVLDSFEVLCAHELRTRGRYETRARTLEALDAIERAQRTGRAYEARIEPPASPASERSP